MGLNILMNAGPWLAVPPGGYGGIENVVATLVPELRWCLPSIPVSLLSWQRRITPPAVSPLHTCTRSYRPSARLGMRAGPLT
jgi:hypothetical protein